MPIHRDFLGWEQPALPAAARWLAKANSGKETWDLGRFVLVVPGGRARRRLLEILVEQAKHVLLPPKIITVGQLPEHLIVLERTANDLEQLLARAQALRSADGAVLKPIVPRPPDPDDTAGWMNLARQIHQMQKELSAAGYDTREALAKLGRHLSHFNDQKRWEALALLQSRYEQTLLSARLHDPQVQLRIALHENTCRSEKHVVLIACTDLNPAPAAMLRQAAAAGTLVTALVHLPQSQADDVDSLGVLLVDRWHDRPIDLPESVLHVVDRPGDQAEQVLRCIEALEPVGTYSPDQITVGIGEAGLGRTIQRTLELGGIPARRATGTAMSQARPLTLLCALGQYGAAGRFDDFSALLRHIDMKSYLEHVGAWPQEATDGDDGDVLTALDRYRDSTLQQFVGEHWLGKSLKLETIHEQIETLLPDGRHTARMLSEWSRPIADMLAAIYAFHRPVGSHHEEVGLVRAIDEIAKALRQQAELDDKSGFVPMMDFAEAIQFTFERVAGKDIPAEADCAAVELLGWLELELDDAPVLILSGFNEGAIPNSPTSDCFLPDGARRVLGLLDDRRRLARDRMALETILRSRRHLQLIAGRRGGQAEPLRPSRLMLACDGVTMARRINRFYAAVEDVSEAPLLLLKGGDESRITIPFPDPAVRPSRPLAVTAFRDYISCPYRFYLKHVLRLRSINDGAVEMAGSGFGNLAHEVLRRFGMNPALADEVDGKKLASGLSALLDEVVDETFGPTRRGAVVLQIEQLRQRLKAFAHNQVKRVQDGWYILPEHVERSYQATIDVAGDPFMITGKIDRIDRNKNSGVFDVIDYKTVEGGRKVTARTTHGSGRGDAIQWRDLQLPLYRLLACQSGIDGPIKSGFFLLSGNLKVPSLDFPDWDKAELASAEACARQIIGRIRGGEFWPPRKPPRFDDGMSKICLDHCPDRRQIIARSRDLAREGGGLS